MNDETPIQNAPGPFQIDQKKCSGCGRCWDKAPLNLALDPSSGKPYVYQQPENQEQQHACDRAWIDCPTKALTENGL